MASGSKIYRVGLVTQSLLYAAGGVAHFVATPVYAAIMPSHYAHPEGLVRLSGVAEILGGVGLLVPASRRSAAWGIVAMLVVYFDVHFYMLENAGKFAPIPKWALQARIPMQFVLIAWAYVYARRRG